MLKRPHYPLEVMLVCVRWYAAYPLSLRHIEEMMQERAVFVDHATVHRWTIKIVPILGAVFRRRKRPAGLSWRMDESVSRTQVSNSWVVFCLQHIRYEASLHKDVKDVIVTDAAFNPAKHMTDTSFERALAT